MWACVQGHVCGRWQGQVSCGGGRGKARKRARGDVCARVRAGAWEYTRAGVPCARACLSAPPSRALLGQHRVCASALLAEPTPRPRPLAVVDFLFFTCLLALVNFRVLDGLFLGVVDFSPSASLAPCAQKKSTTNTKRPPRTKAKPVANELFFKIPPGGEKRSSLGPVFGQAPPRTW